MHWFISNRYVTYYILHGRKYVLHSAVEFVNESRLYFVDDRNNVGILIGKLKLQTSIERVVFLRLLENLKREKCVTETSKQTLCYP